MEEERPKLTRKQKWIEKELSCDYEWQDPKLHDIDRAELYERKKGLASYHAGLRTGLIYRFLFLLSAAAVAIGILMYRHGTAPVMLFVGNDGNFQERVAELVKNNSRYLVKINQKSIRQYEVVANMDVWLDMTMDERFSFCEMVNTYLTEELRSSGLIDRESFPSVYYVGDENSRLAYPTQPLSCQAEVRLLSYVNDPTDAEEEVYQEPFLDEPDDEMQNEETE